MENKEKTTEKQSDWQWMKGLGCPFCIIGVTPYILLRKLYRWVKSKSGKKA